ncbi:MAG TPA: 1-deoxy-D-xylulose-5-phosphate reductoisomerase [Candidatus Xenobia bacterium]|jgi:1-deoxy-D-xylulose-5-phosphate reductoisomerase
MKTLAILGSTGSIGRQTLDVVAAFPERFRVGALVAGGDWQEVARQVKRFGVPFAAMREEEAASRLRDAMGPSVQVRHGGLEEAATLPAIDMVVVAVVGVAGLSPTLAALQAGKDIALVNKEALVVGGSLMMGAARESGRRILPVDSEHSAIFQCLVGEAPEAVGRIVVTCSGGPFRTTPRAELDTVTVAQALAHPNWKMGSKITIDSATLMNKGFEVLEAHHLYDVPLERIDVVVHPESIVHSMVEFVDGSLKAQLGLPDMRLPIQYALGWPERLPRSWQPADFTRMARLTFETPRGDDFPCLGLAYEAGRKGGAFPAVLNAANEVAVARFLAGELSFGEIPRLIEHCLERTPALAELTLAGLLAVDEETRCRARVFRSQVGQRC